MSSKVELEFTYDHPIAGVVSVEALYEVQPPDFYSRYRDWETDRKSVV